VKTKLSQANRRANVRKLVSTRRGRPVRRKPASQPFIAPILSVME